MSTIPWKVRLSACALALVAGGALAGERFLGGALAGERFLDGALAGASEVRVHPAAVPVVRSPESAVPVVRSPQSAVPVVRSPQSAVPTSIRPVPAPVVEPVHAEPGPGVVHLPPLKSRDVTGSRFPSGLTIQGGSKHRAILFTFDDGPSRRHTPRLLDTLDELGITALFFVKSESFGNGNPWEREHAEIVREIVRRGHMIGNHTETHRQLPLLRNAEIEAELALSERKIQRAIGRKPRLIRPPGGALSERVEHLLAENGYTSVMWTLYPGDLEVHTPEDVVRTFFRVLERRERETGERGGIVLLHDTKRHSLDAVPRLVEALRKRNCMLLGEGEELYDVVDDLGYFIPGHEPEQTLEERQEELRERTRRACNTVALR